MLDEIRIGGQVGDIARYAGHVRPEQPGQAHERGIDVAIRYRRALDDDEVDALAGRQQPGQRRAADDDDPAAPSPDDRGIPDELDRVAEAVVGIQQDRPALERAAVPGRLGEPGDGELRALQPPFVLGPAPLEIAHLEPGQGAAEVDLGQVGLDGQRPIIASERLGEMSLGLQRVAEVVMGLGVIGVQPSRPPIAGPGLDEFVLFAQCVAQVVVGLGDNPAGAPGLGGAGRSPRRTA